MGPSRRDRGCAVRTRHEIIEQGTDRDKRHYIDCLCGERLICAGAGTMTEWVAHVYPWGAETEVPTSVVVQP